MLESGGMKRLASAFMIALVVTGAPAASAQQPAYQAQSESSVKFKVDALLRQEWTRDVFVSPEETRDESRRRLRVLPRLEIGSGKLKLGVGGDFNHGSDKNADPKPALLRDNYDSRDARVDLAFASLEPASWVRLEGGRFPMPVDLTEMLWDKDLRPQGGALTLEAKDVAGLQSLGVTALEAKGSHVFDDDKVKLLLLSGQITFGTGAQSKLHLVGSYLRFYDLDTLEPMIRRQNTRLPGVAAPAPLAFDYDVVDVEARFRQEGRVTTQLVADYAWNTAVDEDNRGLWLGLVLGSTQTARGRLEYTYAKVDKDATVAAYAGDDFFWATGWEGHRADLGVKASDRSAFHAVGQLQRFKDSPLTEEREHWLKRLRLEMRFSY